ncbi:unnamed protein product [Ceratitis capitata]|uniref:(Mediterranean fruit fly) hypothetical protein n=1 Tax=Ceratitis capitata TaxID=7213 RepID=A0A811VIE4_CERCA|nr:unnamed protein product [Ceratitis capitata]
MKAIKKVRPFISRHIQYPALLPVAVLFVAVIALSARLRAQIWLTDADGSNGPTDDTDAERQTPSNTRRRWDSSNAHEELCVCGAKSNRTLNLCKQGNYELQCLSQKARAKVKAGIENQILSKLFLLACCTVVADLMYWTCIGNSGIASTIVAATTERRQCNAGNSRSNSNSNNSSSSRCRSQRTRKPRKLLRTYTVCVCHCVHHVIAVFYLVLATTACVALLFLHSKLSPFLAAHQPYGTTARKPCSVSDH